MSQPETYTLHPHARFRAMADAGVFVLQKSGEVIEINGVAACIVDTLRQTGALDDAVDAVCQRFEIDTETARADAEELVAELVSIGALAKTVAA